MVDSGEGSPEATASRAIAALAACPRRASCRPKDVRAMNDWQTIEPAARRARRARLRHPGRAGPDRARRREMLPLMRRGRPSSSPTKSSPRHHLRRCVDSLAAAGIAHHAVMLPPGEDTKDLAHFGKLVEDMLAIGIERGDLLVALGGGVVGDLAGFAAAILLRGIDFVQIPTTLLAQVDSSVGGKTAIDTPRGKNLIGAFHQPRLVLADLGVLATPAAPRAALRLRRGDQIRPAGRSGLLRVAGGERAAGAGAGRRTALRARGAALSCEMKAEIVAEDEREAGDRALLNLGHTFGHALEAETGFGEALKHGEAVALGWRWRSASPRARALPAAQDASACAAHLAAAGLPTRLADIGLPGIAGRPPGRAHGPGQEGREAAHLHPAAPDRRCLRHERRADGAAARFPRHSREIALRQLAAPPGGVPRVEIAAVPPAPRNDRPELSLRVQRSISQQETQT